MDVEPSQKIVPTETLRAKIRSYAHEQREKQRAVATDSFRFGLGQIQAHIKELEQLTEKDIKGLAMRIKRNRHATPEDMYRLSHAFLQDVENIRVFAITPGAIQVLIKELTGKNSQSQISAAECLCNFSLGEVFVCEKISNLAGSYLVTYLDSTAERLMRTSLWTLANILATHEKSARTLISMKLVPKLWSLYTADPVGKTVAEAEENDYRLDAAICFQLISAQKLLTPDDTQHIRQHLMAKNPTCVAVEYHLQFIFNCDVINTENELTTPEVTYLVNLALLNINQATDFASQPNRLRVLYAVRVLSNLLATHASSYSILLQQLGHTNLAGVLNKLFAYREKTLSTEVLWLLRNYIKYEDDRSLTANLLQLLQVYL